MHAIFLHVLADTLGSISVIASYVLYQVYGWTLADPVCSILIALLIVLAVWPLLQSSWAQVRSASPEAAGQQQVHLPPPVTSAILALPGVTAVTATQQIGAGTGGLLVTVSCGSSPPQETDIQRTLRLHGLLGSTLILHSVESKAE